jgi:hypothetical protein
MGEAFSIVKRTSIEEFSKLFTKENPAVLIDLDIASFILSLNMIYDTIK